MEREGWCLTFLIRCAGLAKAKKQKEIKEAERRQTLIRILRILSDAARASRGALAFRRSTAALT